MIVASNNQILQNQSHCFKIFKTYCFEISNKEKIRMVKDVKNEVLIYHL